MGKTEKLVLLSVVLVLVVLFVWSLGGDDGTQAAERDQPAAGDDARYGAADGEPGSGSSANMLDRGNSLLSSELDGDDTDGPRTGSGEALSDGDLGDAAIDRGDRPIGLEPGPGAANPGGAEDVGTTEASGPTAGPTSGSTSGPAREVRMMPGWDLVTTIGLEATVDPDMHLFRPAPDATWESLALDLYGKPALADLLRHNNEGMETPGEVIFVPAKNDLGPEGTVRYVQVLQGETLWAVAERTLGSGSRWKEIYEANQDVVPNPDFLAPGTVLTIPE